MESQTEVRPPGPDDDTVEGYEPKKVGNLRIRVVDTARDGRPALNITVPVAVVRFGMKVAKAFSPEVREANLDWDSIVAMIDEGDLGKLVEIENEADHRTVEVWVE